MSFWLGRDFFDNPIVPSYVLCKSNKERIGSINCINKNITLNYNNLDEIEFKTYLYIDGEKNRYYDEITIMKGVLLPEIGFYIITSVDITSEGTEFEYKSVTAKSSECLLAQKYLETFTINMGTTESINGVNFCNVNDEDNEHSLLHLVLEKVPNWSIGHVDPRLRTVQRCFEIDRQDVYSFLTVDVAGAFECIFEFDTLKNEINVYKEENYSEDTNVYVSFNNLLKSASVSYSDSDIKTCLTLIGVDDLSIRDINLGYDRIFSLGYFHSLEFMSQSLYVAWGKWVEKRSGYLDTYTALLSDYQSYIVQINDLTHNKMPENKDSTNWTEYGLVPLQEKLAEYEQNQSVMMKSGWGNESHNYYKTKYEPLLNTIKAIKGQIDDINADLDVLKKDQSDIYIQMSAIINDLAMDNEINFTQAQLEELSNFIREDELTSDNYVVTDIMTDEEKFAMLDDFLKHGEKELAKASAPQLTFNAEMLNLFSMEEFSSWHEDFKVGNYIHVSLRDEYLVKPKLLSISLDFLDLTDFSVTFGNVVKNGDKLFDVTEAIAMAQSAATSVSFNSSFWNQGCKEADTVSQLLEDGLLSQGKYLKSGADSEMVIDRRGIFINTTSNTTKEQYAGMDSIFLGGGRILFTDDNWKTVAMAVGRADISIEGNKTPESRFGVFADFVIAGYIAGSTIYGGKIKSTNYSAKKEGSLIDLETGTFEFNAKGEQKLTLEVTDDKTAVLTVKGTVKADKGYIGGASGFTIESEKLYSNSKKTLDTDVEGVFVGTSGISLGKKGVFKVTNDGALVATSATVKGTIKADKGYIGGENNGFTIESGKLYSGSKSTLDADVAGVYVGNNGISLGKKDVFKVTSSGAITATSGNIGGWVLSTNGLSATNSTNSQQSITIHKDGSIYAKNGSNTMWSISSSGYAYFKDVSISGVRTGSSFGGISYTGSGTYGSFNNGFSANTSFGLDGGALNNFNSLVVDNITADNIDAAHANIEALKFDGKDVSIKTPTYMTNISIQCAEDKPYVVIPEGTFVTSVGADGKVERNEEIILETQGTFIQTVEYKKTTQKCSVLATEISKEDNSWNQSEYYPT